MKSLPLLRLQAERHRFLNAVRHRAGLQAIFGFRKHPRRVVFAATLLLSACAPYRPDPGKGFGGCGTPMCRPAVSVSAFGNRCSVGVDIDPIKVPKGTVVTWTIAQVAKDPIIFLANGIAIEDPDHDFVLPELGDNGTTFRWTASDQGSSRRPLKYSVHAVWMKEGTDGILCRVLDPVIVNDF